MDEDGERPHRPRCCESPTPEAIWGLGRGDNNFITVTCTHCWTDLITLDPPTVAKASKNDDR